MTNFLKFSRVNISELERVKQFIGSESDPRFFITMTEINKIGVNPRSGYNTPLGVYAYPLIPETYKQLLSGSLPFAMTKPYVNIFTISQPIFNLQNYSQTDLDRDLDVIKKMHSSDEVIDSKINDAIANAILITKNATASKFWNITRELSPGQSILKWNSLLRNLGYSGFYDPGMGLIHPAEPTQAVILDPSIIIPVESFINPHAKLHYKERDFEMEVLKLETLINKVFRSATNVIKIPRDVHRLYGFKIIDRIAQAARERKINPDNAIRLFKDDLREHYGTFIQLDEGTGTLKAAYPGTEYDPFVTPFNLKSKEDSEIVSRVDDFLYKDIKRSRIENLSPNIAIQMARNTKSGENLLSLVSSQNCSVEIIEEILNRIDEPFISSNIYLLNTIFSNKNCTKELILKVIDKIDLDQCVEYITSNENLDKEVLFKIIDLLTPPLKLNFISSLITNKYYFLDNDLILYLLDKQLEPKALKAIYNITTSSDKEVADKIESVVLNQIRNLSEDMNSVHDLCYLSKISKPEDRRIFLEVNNKIFQILSSTGRIDSRADFNDSLLSNKYLSKENLFQIIKKQTDIIYFLNTNNLGNMLSDKDIAEEVDRKILLLINATDNNDKILEIASTKNLKDEALKLIVQKTNNPYTLSLVAKSLHAKEDTISQVIEKLFSNFKLDDDISSDSCAALESLLVFLRSPQGRLDRPDNFFSQELLKKYTDRFQNFDWASLAKKSNHSIKKIYKKAANFESMAKFL